MELKNTRKSSDQKVVIIVQARMNSTRLPGKVMREICGVPMLLLLLARLKRVACAHAIVLATTNAASDLPLVDRLTVEGFNIFVGSEENVLERYYLAATHYNADIIVRITGDCPLVDPRIVDDIIIQFKQSKLDYLANTISPTYPDGLDVEVFSFAALRRAYENASQRYELEHVTPFMRETGNFNVANFAYHSDYSAERWTVDELVDLEVVNAIFAYFHPRIDFSWLEILELRHSRPDLFESNKHLTRNEGSQMSTGQKLWKRAKNIIPGGNMLLSKRPEMFLPNMWPTYFSKSIGCRVWDLDGKEYIDMSLMGVGTNILGYNHSEINAAVKNTVDAGNMSTLNCPEEVYLAERLVELHPWSDMVRLARTGGEANAIAIRIARAASGKYKIAFCGYHGWHDWYLAANIENTQNLSAHLLAGLSANGIPPNLQDTIYPFAYNRFDELEQLVNLHEIGVIKMEVARNCEPQNGFLEKVRRLATDKGIVLIFDECTSGFRETCGGLHHKYGVEPDIAVFGKALGNGYAITAIIGRRAVMEAAQSSFISSTFWTERIGPTAGLKTLEVMQNLKSWDVITNIGLTIRNGWQVLAEKYSLDLRVSGIPALSSFTIHGDKSLEYKTLITQELLKRNFLASTSVYASIAHTPEVLDAYFEALEHAFSLIATCEDGYDVAKLLATSVCHQGFKRLN